MTGARENVCLPQSSRQCCKDFIDCESVPGSNCDVASRVSELNADSCSSFWLLVAECCIKATDNKTSAG